jgi:hypothetical protein
MHARKSRVLYWCFTDNFAMLAASGLARAHHASSAAVECVRALPRDR